MEKSYQELADSGHLLPLMEEFYSLQGEGAHTGKAAYFFRIGGCDVGCYWCDVKESWNPAIHPLTSVDKMVDSAIKNKVQTVVITGGEPLMYNLDHLCSQLKKRNILTFLETSGAYPFSGEWDWVCLSPKRKKMPLEESCNKADELKVIIFKDSDFQWAQENAMRVRENCHLFLQPEWSRRSEIIPRIIDYILKNPDWKLSLQTHKYIGIP